MKKHILSVLVQNQPGVLAHISGMFAARNFNIDSLVVGRTENPEFSRMVIVSTGDDMTLEQIRKQLGKIVTVVKVKELSDQESVERDLLLMQVHCPPEKRGELHHLTEIFRGSVVDIASQSVMLQLAGTEDKVEAFIELCRPYGIKQLSRTGVIAMPRASQSDKPSDDEASRHRRVRQAVPAASNEQELALPPS